MISIIVPVYNVEKFVRDCIKGVLDQSYKDYELLLIDDGSTDSSGDICDAYAAKDKRVKVFHKSNGGLSSARNYGFDKAVGDWVIFLDSDDFWNNNNCLSELYGYATEMDMDILRFDYQAVDEYKNPIELQKNDKTRFHNRVLSNYEIVKHCVAGEWFAWLYLIKRDALDDIRFDETVKFQEDIDFYCRLFARREMRCGYIDRRFYSYRKRSESITTTPKIDNLKGSFDLCEVFYRQSQITPNNNLGQLYRYYSVMMYYWTLGTLSLEPYYSRRHEASKLLSISDIHSGILRKLSDTYVELKYLVFIRPKPCVGVILLHYKNVLMVKLHKLKKIVK